MPLDPTVAVYVPIVEANGQQISPVYSDQYVGLKGAKPTAGIANQPLMAINSGTVITAETLRWLEAIFNCQKSPNLAANIGRISQVNERIIYDLSLYCDI